MNSDYHTTVRKIIHCTKAVLKNLHCHFFSLDIRTGIKWLQSHVCCMQILIDIVILEQIHMLLKEVQLKSNFQ